MRTNFMRLNKGGQTDIKTRHSQASLSSGVMVLVTGTVVLAVRSCQVTASKRFIFWTLSVA
jgi:hypothetical protein